MALNLSERDIEDWIYDNPGALNLRIAGWIGRQYKLPSGIADLIGYRDDHVVVVIEVKNVPINKAALTQVARYTYDVQDIVGDFRDYPGLVDWQRPYVQMVLAGPSIDEQTALEAEAMGIDLVIFEVALRMRLTRLAPTDIVDRGISLSGFSERPEWAVLGRKAWDEKGDRG